MLEIKTADLSRNELYDDLKDLFEVSFSLEKSEADFFFRYKYIPHNCVVCLKDNQLVSALHMFYTNILDKELKKEHAYYLYGAATLPEFRNMGFMKKTIDYANNIARDKGCKYSVLLPANDGLERFYEKLGYHSLFKANFLEFTFYELKKIAGYNENNKLAPDTEHNVEKFKYSTFEEIREKFYSLAYDVCWDEKHIRSIVNASDFYSKADIKSILREKSYAICHLDLSGENTVEVIELGMVEPPDIAEIKLLLCAILSLMPAKMYIFRVPVGRVDFLEKLCDNKKLKNWGMIKSLGKAGVNLPDTKRPPYLGLTLD
ncbi:MAG: GNAT family N-acetyltransferase [Clostridia bacterium]|nr:GNAT family N-acetyltransferase [Clostridia bacterium]